MSTHREHRLVLGCALIAVGLAVYFDFDDRLVLALVGGAFLSGYFARGSYDLLVPGCIILGLAAGVTLDRAGVTAVDASMIGLGAGFVAVFLIPLALRRPSHWWPLLPGAALLLLGLPQVGRFAEDHWPLALILIGVVVVAAALLGWPSAPSRQPRPRSS